MRRRKAVGKKKFNQEIHVVGMPQGSRAVMVENKTGREP